MKHIISIILCFIFFVSPLYAQQGCGEPLTADQMAFASGERLTYSVTYSAAIISTDVADVTFHTSVERRDNREMYRINAYGKTRPFYDMFFNLEDTYDTWLDKTTLRPTKSTSKLKEGGYLYNTAFDYNWNNKQVYTIGHNIKRQAIYKKTMPLGNCSFDALALFYNMRCRDFAAHRTGERHSVQLVLEDTIRTINYRYLGRADKPLGKVGKVRTLRFACQFATSNDESFKDGAEFILWISDDKNHIPIYIESPIRVGKITATLTSWSGLANPFASIVVNK